MGDNMDEAQDGQAAAPDPRDFARQRMQTNAKGDPKQNAYNLGTILRHDPRWRGRLRCNEFSGRMEVRARDGWRPIEDADAVDVGRWVSEHYELDYTTPILREQMLSAAREVKAHPVREYLRSLTWDGVPRLDLLLSVYFGAEHGDIVKRIGRAWLVAMVARVMQPGCKVDTVPVLIGGQGKQKSSTLRAMMPVPSWFCDSDLSLGHSQDKYQILGGVWLFEIAELDKLIAGKASAAEVKAYVTSQVDTFRRSHGHFHQSVPRQVVFVGTVNPDEFLNDPTGARRFWPVRIGQCRPDRMTADRDQLWAEAYAAWANGETWWFSADVAAALVEMADEHAVVDAWLELVAAWVKDRTSVTVSDVLLGAVQMDIERQDERAASRVRSILMRLRWTKGGRTGPRGKSGPHQWFPPE